jgi:hypothetical protein
MKQELAERAVRSWHEPDLEPYFCNGRIADRQDIAESGMTALEMETVESSRSLGIVPADLMRPVPLVNIRKHRAECADTAQGNTMQSREEPRRQFRG